MIKITRWTRAAAAAAALFCSSSCVEDGGTEIPNELVGREYIAGKGSAAAAEIKLVPVQYVPGGTQGPDSANSLLFTTKTDDEGRFAFRDVPAGQYNIIATGEGYHSFRDHQPITGKGQQLGADTLERPGALTGYIALEPQDDVQTVTVQIVGTTRFANVDANGFFRLPELGAGRYQLRAVTSLQNYTPKYANFEIDVGRETPLADTLRPHYSAIPVVRGLTVTPGPLGTMALRWERSASSNVTRYLIYRDDISEALPTQKPFAWTPASETVFVDTLYHRETGSGRYGFYDPAPHTVSYHVNILDRSGTVGPTFGFVEATGNPPAGVRSGKWSLAAGPGVTSGRHTKLLAFRDSLWTFSVDDSLLSTLAVNDSLPPNGTPDAPDSDSARIRVSPDGKSWRDKDWPANLPAPLAAATVWKNELWALAAYRRSVDNALPGNVGDTGFVLWRSGDGRGWTRESRLPGPSRRGAGFLAFRDSLWVISGRSGHPWEVVADLPALRTGDGKKWDRVAMDRDPALDGSTLDVLGDALFAVGSIDTLPVYYRSKDAIHWDVLPTPLPLVPRRYNTVTVHSGRLWVIGGSLPMSQPYESPLGDVWSSPDGIHWDLVDGVAPFGNRWSHSAASFKGKLWVLGGWNRLGPLTDLWAMDP